MAAHDNAGHLGARKTVTRLRETCYWPTLKRDVYKYVLSYDECQKRSRITVFDRVSTKPVIRAEGTFDVLCCDVSDPIEPPSAHQYTYILVIIDQMSRWPECVPLKTLTVVETCDAFLSIFHRLRISNCLVIENVNNSVSNLNVELYKSSRSNA